MEILLRDKFEGCILGGAIGDAWGSSFENILPETENKTYYLDKSPKLTHSWQLTDDTILTLATCEVLSIDICTPEILGNKFVEYFNRKEIIGIGASTLKAIQDLRDGFHWTQAGRKGEYAAGNGSAMRIAPFAFYSNYERESIRNFSRLTHDNDEAYVGALAIYLVIRELAFSETIIFENIIEKVINELPDTKVRDRMIELKNLEGNESIQEISKLGNNGYVVNSIPFSIYSASRIMKQSFEDIIDEVIKCGGDTDTNASITGQIMGTYLGHKKLPSNLLVKLREVKQYNKIENIIFR